MSAHGDDKENADAHLDLPKKRAKAAPEPPGPARTGRTASRKVAPSQVLSPKCNNSRTLPRSPLKAGASSPQKSYLTRPASPLKPASTAAGTEISKSGPRAASGM